LDAVAHQPGGKRAQVWMMGRWIQAWSEIHKRGFGSTSYKLQAAGCKRATFCTL